MIIEAAALFAAGAAQAQSPPGPVSSPAAQEAADVADGVNEGRGPQSRWFARTGIAAALYNSGAEIEAGGVPVPGATVRVTDDVTPILDVGYNLTDRLAVQVMVGVPPRATAIGKGTVAPFGELGAVRLGPVVATVVYRILPHRGFRPYVGAGATYVFIFKEYDGAVTDLDTHGNWGVALQGGVEYQVSRNLELFADYKRLWLKVKAEGVLGPAPIRGRVTLDPDLLSAGIKLNFR